MTTEPRATWSAHWNTADLNDPKDLSIIIFTEKISWDFFKTPDSTASDADIRISCG